MHVQHFVEYALQGLAETQENLMKKSHFEAQKTFQNRQQIVKNRKLDQDVEKNIHKRSPGGPRGPLGGPQGGRFFQNLKNLFKYFQIFLNLFKLKV